MSTNLTGRTRVVIDLKNVKDLAPRIDETLDQLGIDTGIKWSFGEGEKAVNVLYHAKHTITGGNQETLDINLGATNLKDAFGDALTLKAIKFLYVKNTSTEHKVSLFGKGGDDLLLMDPDGAENVDKVVLEKEGFFLWACPTAAGVVTTTNKYLELTAGAGAGDAIIEVVILGVKV